MPASVHLKRLTGSAKPFRIRAYKKRGEGEGPRSTTRLNTKAKSEEDFTPPASAVLLIFRLALVEPFFHYLLVPQPRRHFNRGKTGDILKEV
jgi:hypothetical protein